MDATVILNGEERTTITVPYGENVTYSVSKEGYITQEGILTATRDYDLEIILDRQIIGYAWTHTVAETDPAETYTVYTSTANPQPNQTTIGGNTIATTSEDGQGNVEGISIGNVGYVRDSEANVRYGDTIPEDEIPQEEGGANTDNADWNSDPGGNL